MPNNQFINLEELSKTTQALLSKINEQSNLKVNKHNVSAEYTEGTKIAEIEDVEIYAPIQEIDTSAFVTEDDLSAVAYTGDFNSLNNIPSLATVAHTGDYNNLSNKPDTSTFMVKGRDRVTAGQKSGTTLGTCATAEGQDTTASSNYAHAEGFNTTASSNYAHAEGNSTLASAYAAHAEGNSTTANGASAHAEGLRTTAQGIAAHAEGVDTVVVAASSGSHAEGTGTKAQGRSQHVFGEYNIQDTAGNATYRGAYVEIVGNGTSTTRSNARTLDWSGNEILAGKLTVGTGPSANMDVTTKQYVDNNFVYARRNTVEDESLITHTSQSIRLYQFDDDTNKSAEIKMIREDGTITLKAGYGNTDNNAITITPTETTLRNVITPTTGDMAANKTYVDGAISTAIGNVNSFNVNIVSGDLPTTNIDTHTIYFKSNSTTGSNVYDEYMYINNNWELIGSTQIDLTPYALSANLATVATSGDYDDLLDAPVAEDDENVEDMLDSFNLDYTTTPGASINMWQGGNY